MSRPKETNPPHCVLGISPEEKKKGHIYASCPLSNPHSHPHPFSPFTLSPIRRKVGFFVSEGFWWECVYVCVCMDVQGCHSCRPPTHSLPSHGPVFKLLGGERKATSCLVFNICFFSLVLFVPYSGSGINVLTSLTEEATLFEHTDPATLSSVVLRICRIPLSAPQACEKPAKLSHCFLKE